MTWPQIAFFAFLTVAIMVGWARYSLEKGLWRRLAELYLWLVPVSLTWLEAIHDVRGLTVTVAIGVLHLLLIVVALWSLGGARTVDASGRSARLASFLLIVGSAIVWLGAATFPGMELEGIHAHRADHLFTTGLFLLGAVITLAGFTVLTALLRESGHPLLAELGLVAFLFGCTFLVIHLAFRGVVMVVAAEELLAAGIAPSWYGSWRPWAGLMYGVYMTTAYLATAAYAGAMLATGWVGKGWGRTFATVGVLAAVGFVAHGGFDRPRPQRGALLVQFVPYAMGIVLLRRATHQELFARGTAASGNG